MFPTGLSFNAWDISMHPSKHSTQLSAFVYLQKMGNASFPAISKSHGEIQDKSQKWFKLRDDEKGGYQDIGFVFGRGKALTLGWNLIIWSMYSLGIKTKHLHFHKV